MKTIEEQINEAAEKLKPYLRRDGGDFEVVKFKDGLLYIKLLGMCAGCGSSSLTIESIEEYMIDAVPGVIGVREI